MMDIVKIEDGKDLRVADSIVPKAANVLSVQLGDLEYSPNFGVDLKYFLQEGLQFENDSFKTYLVQRLTEQRVNVSDVLEQLTTFVNKYTFKVNETETSGGLIL